MATEKKSKKAEPEAAPVAPTEGVGVAPVGVSAEEKVQRLRSAALPREIAEVPQGIQLLSEREHSAAVKRVAHDDAAELSLALQQLADLDGAVLVTDLGKGADPARFTQQRAALVATQAAAVKARALVAYLDQKEAVLLSDGSESVKRAARKVRERSEEDPSALSRYNLVVKFGERHGERVAEGRAAKKPQPEG